MNNKPMKPFIGNLHKIEQIAENLRLKAKSARREAEKFSLEIFLNSDGIVDSTQSKKINYLITEEQVYNRVADQITALLRPDEVKDDISKV